MGDFDIYVKEYKNAKWKAFMKDVKPSGVKIKGIPQDIVDAVVHNLGHSGEEWLQKPLTGSSWSICGRLWTDGRPSYESGSMFQRGREKR